MKSATEKRKAFRELHKSGCFVIPNPWDVGSARILQHMGFQALASTSAGFAWSIGKPDHLITLDEKLYHLTKLCNAVDLPVNADFESGFAREPADVARNVTAAIKTGVSGLSIEDTKEGGGGLYDLKFAVERIKAAKAAIKASGEDVILVARSEHMLHDPKALTPAIDKLVAFAEAGADCLFGPGVKDKAEIAQMVKAVAPLPLSVLVMGPEMSVQDYADLGVRRLSVGASLARVAISAFEAAADQLKEGSFKGLSTVTSSRKLNEIFGSFE
jgi:2-methylisocitrate lyase-like PEP mutase family enzyme